ncbi:proclotting enzyme-like isoform X1 [Venturia canescens]|uniref:proclotting enzyme-like isoform X1 n=1 Tax=Venturia canescens TaxID=32260 RepID=UPI001C9BE1F1|nr:proclotting enzyme-like isoform X1 [Venturia canescens]
MTTLRKCRWFLTLGMITLWVDIARGSSSGRAGDIGLRAPLGKSPAAVGAISSGLESIANRTDPKDERVARERRFIRFPTGPGAIYEGPGPTGRNIAFTGIRFAPQHPQYPPWRQQKSSYWRSPPSSSSAPNEYPRPVMAHRTPRLIFRDDFPSLPTGGAGVSFFQSNQLPELDEDYRDFFPDHRKPIANDFPRLDTESRKESKRPLWEGDDTLCADGRSCEFFLKCWMSAGLLDGSCGGIMYACCHRKDAKAISSSPDYNTITSESTRDHLQPQFPPDIDASNIEHRCGISTTKQTAQRRIVGGDEAGFGSFPWQAYIRIGSSRCGGTLVNRYHVVTAGHCVAKATARQVQVTLGDYVVNSASETLPAYTFGVREIRVHPYFKFTPQADRFDVAVLRLDRPVHYMPHISPICLPDRNEDFLGQYGWAAGWGALQAGSRLRPKTLQAVDVPVIDNRVCERWHRSNGINVVIYDEMMCAGYRAGGKDSCQGDSGGPLMLEKTGRWYLIGIVSAGYSCAQPGQPGIYHRVAKTVDWITYVINS